MKDVVAAVSSVGELAQTSVFVIVYMDKRTFLDYAQLDHRPNEQGWIPNQNLTGTPFPPLPSPPFPFLSLPFPPVPLEVGPLNPARGSGGAL